MKAIKEMLAKVKLYAQLDIAIVDKLEEIEKRVYCLEEDMKLARGSNRSNAQRISELTLSLGTLKRGE